MFFRKPISWLLWIHGLRNKNEIEIFGIWFAGLPHHFYRKELLFLFYRIKKRFIYWKWLHISKFCACTGGKRNVTPVEGPLLFTLRLCSFEIFQIALLYFEWVKLLYLVWKCHVHRRNFIVSTWANPVTRDSYIDGPFYIGVLLPDWHNMYFQQHIGITDLFLVGCCCDVSFNTVDKSEKHILLI